MNKIIFQVGLLAFCISTVIFSVLGLPLLEVIAKAFIVFIAAIAGIIAIVFIAAAFSDKEKEYPVNDAEQAQKTGKTA